MYAFHTSSIHFFSSLRIFMHYEKKPLFQNTSEMLFMYDFHASSINFFSDLSFEIHNKN